MARHYTTKNIFQQMPNTMLALHERNNAHCAEMGEYLPAPCVRLVVASKFNYEANRR